MTAIRILLVIVLCWCTVSVLAVFGYMKFKRAYINRERRRITHHRND